MSSLVCRSHRGQGGRKLEINIPQKQICANSKGGLINEGGVISNEYGSKQSSFVSVQHNLLVHTQ